jgi:hypothetical protein
VLDLAVAPAPLAGVKLSRLVADRDGRISFAPLYQRRFTATFAAFDRAVCAVFGAHPAPNDACTCGFYAVPDLAELHRFAVPPPSAVCLHARFGGAVVEHDFGFRAQFQLVDAVSLPTRCGWCATRPPVALRARRADDCSLRVLVPVCRPCATRRSTVELDSAAASLGVPFAAPVDVSALAAPTPGRTRPLAAAGALTVASLSAAALGALPAPVVAASASLVPLVWWAHPRLSLATRLRLDDSLGSLRHLLAGPHTAHRSPDAPRDATNVDTTIDVATTGDATNGVATIVDATPNEEATNDVRPTMGPTHG